MTSFLKKAAFAKWINNTKLSEVFEGCDDIVLSEIPDDFWNAESILTLLEKAFYEGTSLKEEMEN